MTTTRYKAFKSQNGYSVYWIAVSATGRAYKDTCIITMATMQDAKAEAARLQLVWDSRKSS